MIVYAIAASVLMLLVLLLTTPIGRWIVWSVRTSFCGHDWKREECVVQHYERDYYSGEPKKTPITYTMVNATCEKCGWHRAYRKW